MLTWDDGYEGPFRNVAYIIIPAGLITADIIQKTTTLVSTPLRYNTQGNKVILKAEEGNLDTLPLSAFTQHSWLDIMTNILTDPQWITDPINDSRF